MTSIVNPIPAGYHTVTPYLIVQGAAGLVEFLTQAFGAQECDRTTRPDGTLAHASVRIGDSMVMLSEACDSWKPTPASIYLYVDDTDATYERAIQAGSTSLMQPEDHFYGDRSAGVRDPFGNSWWIGTHQEDVSPEEVQKRLEAYMAQQASQPQAHLSSVV